MVGHESNLCRSLRMLAHPNGKTGQGVDGFDVIGRRPGQLPLVANFRGHEDVTAEVAGMDDLDDVGEEQGPGSERASDRDGFLGDESALASDPPLHGGLDQGRAEGDGEEVKPDAHGDENCVTHDNNDQDDTADARGCRAGKDQTLSCRRHARYPAASVGPGECLGTRTAGS